MANHSYIFQSSDIPKSYEDRPEAIHGVGEFAYYTPFIYLLLISDDPQVSACLLSDGFEDEEEDNKTKLYAVTGKAEGGLKRTFKFLKLLELIGKKEASFLAESAIETRKFLESKISEDYFHLETIELDAMNVDEDDENYYANSARWTKNEAIDAGKAIDALSNWNWLAIKQLKKAVRDTNNHLNPLNGIVLTDDFDNTRDAIPDTPIGLYLHDVLYYSPQNREQFESDELD